MTVKKYTKLDELPNWVTAKVHQFRPRDAEKWIFESVSALDNKSVMELMNSGEEGQNEVRRYLTNIAGHFLFD